MTGGLESEPRQRKGNPWHHSMPKHRARYRSCRKKRYVRYLPISTLQKRLLRTAPTVAAHASAVATHMPFGLEVVFA